MTDTICKECHKALCKCGPDDPFGVMKEVDERIERSFRARQDWLAAQAFRSAQDIEYTGPPVDDEIDTGDEDVLTRDEYEAWLDEQIMLMRDITATLPPFDVAEEDWPEWRLPVVDDHAWFWSQVAQVAWMQYTVQFFMGKESMISLLESRKL